jgi:phage FluMu gp28-like protein
MNFYPHAAQRKIIDGSKQNTTIAAGRRFGKSVLFAALALYYALTNKNSTQFVIAPSQDQARIIFSEIERLVSQSTMLQDMVETQKSFPFPMIKFKSGSIIHARSIGGNEGKYLRGHKADKVYLDECAFISNSVIENVISPLLADTDGGLYCISTPLGQRGYFYESFMRGQKSDPLYASFQFSSYENPHISHDFINRQRSIIPSIQFDCEWMAKFVDDSICVFKGESVNTAMDDFQEEIKPEEGHNYWLGVDVAKIHDYTAITVIDGTDQKSCKVVFTERFNGKPYSYVIERIIQLATIYSAQTVHIDQTGVGEGVIEQISSILPNAEGFTFTQASKVSLINTLKTGLEQHRIKISAQNETLLNEIKYYQYDITDMGVVRMNAPSGSHDDMLISLALAYQKLAVQYAGVGVELIEQKGQKRESLNSPDNSVVLIDGTPLHEGPSPLIDRNFIFGC